MFRATTEVLDGVPGIELALLFGSQARGSARPDSDLDLAVLAPSVDRLALARELSLATGCEVDVVDLSEASIPLCEAILRDGVVVHEARSGRAAQWRSHAMAAMEIDGPWFARMASAWIAHLAEGSER